MEWIRQYLLSVTAAALLCSVIQNLAGKKGTCSAIVKMLCGLFMSVTLFSPLLRQRLPSFSYYFEAMEAEGSSVAEEGWKSAKEAMSGIIKEKTETYILDKASALDVCIQAEVMISDADVPYPSHVKIQGPAAPYAKQQLQSWIEATLGIPKENQSWI